MEDITVKLSSFQEGGYQPLQERVYEEVIAPCDGDIQEHTLDNISHREIDQKRVFDTDNNEDEVVIHHKEPETNELITDVADVSHPEHHQLEENVDETHILLHVSEQNEPHTENHELRVIAREFDTTSHFHKSHADEIKPMINGNEQGSPPNSSQSEVQYGFEAVLIELGEPGKFFWIQFFLHSLANFCLSNTVLIYVFTGFEPPHTCKKLTNESDLLSRYQLFNESAYQVHYETCDIIITSNTNGSVETVASLPCLDGHDYNGNKHISFVSEWDMVCGNVGLKELVQIVLLVGQTLGGVVFTSIADRCGRKPIFLLSNLCLCGSGLGAAYAPNIYVLIVFRFFCGLFQQGTGLLSYTIIMEFLTARHRQVAGVLAGLIWTFSVIAFSALAYLMRDESWRTLQMATALFACNVFLGPMFLYESPRWLTANKKYHQALAIIQKACQTNGKDYEKVKAVYERSIQMQEVKGQAQGTAGSRNNKAERYSLLDIVRHRTLLVSALIMWFIWITVSSTYYGLFLLSSSLAGDRHLNFFLMAVADLPSDIVNFVLFTYFGRKPIIMGWLLVAGSGLLTATMLMTFGTTALTRALSSAFSFVGKVGTGASFNSIFMYTPELFPTNLRSAGLGVCSSVARLGGMAAPYAQTLANIIQWGPGILFSAMCFLSALLFIKLPETKGYPMPSTIKEMKQRVNQRKTLLYQADILQSKEASVTI